MRRSSRILCFLLVFGTMPASAQARGLALRFGIGLGGSPVAGPGLGIRPGFGVRPGLGLYQGFGVRPGFGVRSGLGVGSGFGGGLRPRRFGRGFGYGGSGFGLGGTSDFSVLPPAGQGPGYEPPPGALAAGLAPPLPACPLIISVGQGLRHPARVRVVYGSAPACGR